MAQHWYALYCKPRKERLIWHQLVDRGYEVFFPRVLSKAKNGEKQSVRPLFPRYLFVHLDVEEDCISKFQWMEHSAGLVCIDGKPFHIPDSMIAAIQKRMAEINSLNKKPLYLREDVISEQFSDGGIDFLRVKLEPCTDDEQSLALISMFLGFVTETEKDTYSL